MKNFYSLGFGKYPKERIYLDGNIRKKYEHDLTTVVIEENNNSDIIRYLILPLHRFSKSYHTIILPNTEMTMKQLTDIIYNFYNKKELTLLELKNLDDDDIYDYIRDITISKKKDPDLIVNPIDIMGDKEFLECITIYQDDAGDIQYMLHLGS